MSFLRRIAILNALIETSRDGVEGFRKCAKDCRDPSLKKYFQDRAKDYAEAVRSLSDEVRGCGGVPSLSLTARRELNRTWIDLKTAFNKKDKLAVLKECERIEIIVLELYQEALEEELPESLNSLLIQQLNEVRRNYDLVRQLRDEAKNTSKKE